MTARQAHATAVITITVTTIINMFGVTWLCGPGPHHAWPGLLVWLMICLAPPVAYECGHTIASTGTHDTEGARK